ncbi:MAG: M48 family metalloprotease [Deltaproteobacteria bacterium]|nr:M48 family metalloprotease [Deltaproteobacteria bacterium]
MSYPYLLTTMAALFVTLAWTGSWVALPLSRLWPTRRGRRQPATTRAAAIVLTPVVLGALACAAVVVPNIIGGCHCPAHGGHHSHLCLVHPGFALPLVGPGLALLALWLLAAAPRLIGFARDLYATHRLVRAARRQPARSVAGVPVRVVDWGMGGAFTIGVLSPVIVMDRRLVETLDEAQLRAIALHEQAHVSRRDGLTMAMLRLCQSLWPVFGAATGLERWQADVERECDQHAATQLGDSTCVAEALITVERLRANQPNRPAAAVPRGALGIDSAPGIESRVMALLDFEPAAGRPQGLANDLFGVLIVAAGLAVLMITWPGDALHHAVEHALVALTSATQG